MSKPCVCARIRRSSRIVTGLYDELLAPSGTTTQQFSILRTLQKLGPSSISALAAETAHERSSLSRTLRPLEARGLVRFEPGADQRERLVALTVAGQSSIREILPLWTEAQARVDACLGPDGPRLFRLLERLEQLRP